MAAGSFVVYDVFIDQLGKEGHNLSSDALKVGLITSSYTPSTSHTAYATTVDAYEISSTDTGYTAGGATLGTVTWSGGVLNAANTQWTAGSAGIPATKYAVIYNSSLGAANNLIAYVELEVGGTVSVTSGNTLTIDYHDTNGIVKLAAA
jgi:hypothetical protein